MHNEIKNIFGHLRNSLKAHQDIGLDPPFVSFNDLESFRPPVVSVEKPDLKTAQPTTLEKLRAEIGDCKRCKLHQGRKRLVFGQGSPSAELIFVGEAPGKDEDAAGEPFVGKAGKLLTKIIENGMGLSRRDVYICNILKCRPPNNRDPEPDEIKTCIPFLKRQIKLIKPKVICTLGRVSGQALLGGDFMITKRRGQWTTYMNIPLMPTFHPAYLLRNPSAKREVWADVQQIMKRLGLEVKNNG